MIRGDRLRQLRESLGYSREKLASTLNIGVSQLGRYEYEQNDPTSDVVSRLANFFGVSTDYLLGHSDLPTPTFDDTTLSDKELAVVAALRQGERLKAIQIIADDRSPA
jgi:transcriptional regulator with XRE-family HTH domain